MVVVTAGSGKQLTAEYAKGIASIDSDDLMVAGLQSSSSGYFGVITKYSALEDKHNGIIIAVCLRPHLTTERHSQQSALQAIHLDLDTLSAITIKYIPIRSN